MRYNLGVIIQSWGLRLITLTKTLNIMDITKTEFNNTIVLLYMNETKKWKSYFCFFTYSKQDKVQELTWLPLEIMHHSHTCMWYNNLWPWVSLTWLLYNLQLDDVTGAHCDNSLSVDFQPIRKEIVSSMYNNTSYRTSWTPHTTKSCFKTNPEARLHDLANWFICHVSTNRCQQQCS